ncbi:MAG: DUF4301 family protein [Bacteroidaceae bacterium]|nr:DUF4301 family protein [Bacteroidaceae bacterium]
MDNESDLRQLREKGITEEQLQAQLNCFATGFPYLRLHSAASVGNGIMQLSEAEADRYVALWNDYKGQGHCILKFVPASGAASRMFKDLYAFLDADRDEPSTDFEKTFFRRIHDFAFFDALNDACMLNAGMGVDALIAQGDFKEVVAQLLGADGLDYGNLPKGLLQFHTYPDEARTPLEEHMAEAAQYASSQGEARLHFTVSAQHRELFEDLAERVAPDFESRYGVTYDITMSEQKPSTDTVAANPDGTPFRQADGSLLFRPGGHGALIENLNDLEADVIFIKNIDNVVPDALRDSTVRWKQVIAGILVDAQRQTFEHLARLGGDSWTASDVEETASFLQNVLCCTPPEGFDGLPTEAKRSYLLGKLDRPIRVCGMVRNEGEPGGGPFRVYDAEGSVSLQILESTQIDSADPTAVAMLKQSTHFNPVDLVCAVRGHDGKKFCLTRFVDPQTGFISSKSKDGRPLQALELPGLWNGAMSDWNTLMVEVPASTFNPVKTVNDLLRPSHQPLS